MPLLKLTWTPTPRALRQFSVLLVLVLGILAIRLETRHTLAGIALAAPIARRIALGLGALGLLGGGLGLLWPRTALPAYRALSLLGYPIGLLVSSAIVALLYYGVVTPIGLVGRMLGWNPMARGFLPAAPSYWQARPENTDRRRYFLQY